MFSCVVDCCLLLVAVVRRWLCVCRSLCDARCLSMFVVVCCPMWCVVCRVLFVWLLLLFDCCLVLFVVC